MDEVLAGGRTEDIPPSEQTIPGETELAGIFAGIIAKDTTTYACGCQKIREFIEGQMRDEYLPVKHIYCEPHQAAITAAEEHLAQLRRDIAAQTHTVTKTDYYRTGKY